jgi:radical SAM protein with 4Fe4S-binding SPASM domain
VSVEGPAPEPESPNLYQQMVARSQKQHRLFSAHWELTYRCNERCTHCYLEVLPPSARVPGELTTEECLRVVDELAALGVLNLTLSGGEILVRRDLIEIAEYARSKQFALRLFTNGILIKLAVADRLAALHPYAVEVSLYGAEAASHEVITRRPRSFELSIRGLRLLHERGVRTVIKTPLMRHNVRQFHALEALAEELGAQFRYDITITPQDSGGLSPLQHRLTDDDLLWLFRTELDPTLWAGRVIPPDRRTCGIASSGLVIDPYGNVFPCVQTRIVAGNVREQSLQAIWQSETLHDLAKLTLNELPVCRTCELRNLCVRCHGLAQVEDGDLHGPASVNCREALARRQVLIEKGALPPDYPIPAHLQSQVWWLMPVQELARVIALPG